MRRYRLPPHSATHNLESEPQFWNSDVAYFLVLVLLSVRLYHHTTVVVNRVRPSQSVDNIHRPLLRHGCETASYRRDDIPIITSHDCESWYWFHRVCMSVCVCLSACLHVSVSTKRKLFLETCLAVCTNVSGSEYFDSLFVTLSEQNLSARQHCGYTLLLHVLLLLLLLLYTFIPVISGLVSISRNSDSKLPSAANKLCSWAIRGIFIGLTVV